VPSRTLTLPPAGTESVAVSVCAIVLHAVPVDVPVAAQSLSGSSLPAASATMRKHVLALADPLNATT